MDNPIPAPKWYDKTWLVILLCFFLFPIGLYALWKNASISKGWKISITAFIIVAVLSQLSNHNKIDNSSTINSTSATGKAKVQTFNDVNKLVDILSKNGIGQLSAWKNSYDSEWGSLTNYYQFGSEKGGNGLKNNLAYYIEGDETYAKSLLINLNIHNKTEKKQALILLSEITSKTFKSLDLEIPEGLLKSIEDGEAFQATNESFSTSFILDKSKIETWKVTILSK